jgi:hypothetical protein
MDLERGRQQYRTCTSFSKSALEFGRVIFYHILFVEVVTTGCPGTGVGTSFPFLNRKCVVKFKPFANDPITQEAEAEDCKFEAGLGYLANSRPP